MNLKDLLPENIKKQIQGSKNTKKIVIGEYEYVVDETQKVKPNDFCYMSPTYSNGKDGFIIKVSSTQKYPKTKEEQNWTKKDDGSVYEIVVITPEVLGNKHKPSSYHLSHCNNAGSGKVVSSNNPKVNI